MKAYLIRNNQNVAAWAGDDKPYVHWIGKEMFILRGNYGSLKEEYNEFITHLEKEYIGQKLKENEIKEINFDENQSIAE